MFKIIWFFCFRVDKNRIEEEEDGDTTGCIVAVRGMQ
jgi:hypothetical protein